MANRHAPNWISPANLALTPVSFRLPEETVHDLDEAAAIAGLSKRQTVKQAIAEFAERQRAAARTPRRSPRRAAAHAP